MFNTFTIPSNNTFSNPLIDSPPPKHRPKRKQVSKACNLCRISRTKCDISSPCSNCSAKGLKCNRDSTKGSRSLSSVILEIEKLQSTVKTLQARSNVTISSPESSSGDTPPLSYETSIQGEDHQSFSWKGLELDIDSTGSLEYFGPSSIFVFLGRISYFLSSIIEKPVSVAELCPRLDPCPAFSSESPKEMPRAHQEFFLGIFWQNYHSLLPIICEAEFMEHFDLSWSGTTYQPSPVVDILLAICIQYGESFLSNEETVESDATRFYFNRCRNALNNCWDTPTLSVVQSYIFITIHLKNASRPRSAHSFLARGVRAACSLGLHVDHLTIPTFKEELRKRAWWTLVILDTKLSIELGVPRCTDLSEISRGLPRDDAECSSHTITNFQTAFEDISWLSFHKQEVLLFEEARIVNKGIFSQKLCVSNIYTCSQELERCAEMTSRHMKRIHTWAERVPSNLRTPRRSGGLPYSTDRTPVEIDSTLPMWLQIQRLTLELEYHQLCMSFYRPFICFMPHMSKNASPLADGLSILALNHAMAITHIIHSVLTSIELWNSWYPAYQFQWNAAVTIMAFTLATPVCPLTPVGRRSIPVALEVFGMLGKYIPIANRAAKRLEQLNGYSKTLMEQFRKALDGFRTEMSPPPMVMDWGQGTAQIDSELMWPEVDQYNVDMWAEFLNGFSGADFASGSPYEFLDHGELNIGVENFGSGI